MENKSTTLASVVVAAIAMITTVSCSDGLMAHRDDDSCGKIKGLYSPLPAAQSDQELGFSNGDNWVRCADARRHKL